MKKLLLTAIAIMCLGIGCDVRSTTNTTSTRTQINHQTADTVNVEISSTAPNIEELSSTTSQQFLVQMQNIFIHHDPPSHTACASFHINPPSLGSDIVINYPQLRYLNNKSVQQKINKALYNDSRSEYQDFLNEDRGLNGKCIGGGFRTAAYYLVPSKFPSIFSVDFKILWDHRLAHPVWHAFARSYDTNDGRLLTLAMLFKASTPYVGAIDSYINKYFLENYGANRGYDTHVDLNSHAFRPAGEQFNSFFVANDGLIIQFDGYQVGDHGTYTPELFIPYSYLKDYIDPKGLIANWESGYERISH